jgi:hypothetical protein
MWGAKADLKHAYFHLHNTHKLLPYMRVNIGQEVYQFPAAVFGMNILPHLFMGVMKVLQKLWRNLGLLVFIYLDDILILGNSQRHCQSTLTKVLGDLLAAGVVVNQKKSSPDQ